MRRSKRWAVILSLFCASAIVFVDQPVQAQTVCSPSNPAAISGSTGAQGVLDPTNYNASLGLVWPTNAVTAEIALDTGVVVFLNSSNGYVGIAQLPGSPTNPFLNEAFSDGKLNFVSIRLPTGKKIVFWQSFLDKLRPLFLLSCEDVIFDSGSSMAIPELLYVPNAQRRIGLVTNSQGTVISTVVVSPQEADLFSLVPLPNGNNYAGTGTGEFITDGPVAMGFPGGFGFGPHSGQPSRPLSGSLYPPIGGAGGSAADPLGPFGGRGGPATVFAANQRITVNGAILANGGNAQSGTPAAQGGAGGSVRLAAVLVEGNGTINTSAGLDSDGVKRSPDGPIEIQAFLQDLFSPCTSPRCTTTPIPGNPVAAPITENLPEIHVDSVWAFLDPLDTSPTMLSIPTNSGSLSTPDFEFPSFDSSRPSVRVFVDTIGVPEGKLLTFRAVGTDGSVSTATDSVVEGIASADLTLNPGATYQIVVYPDTAFELANMGTPPVPMSNKPVYAGLQMGPNIQESEVRSQKTEVRRQTKAAANLSETRVLSPLEKWARAFGVDPEAHQKMARLKTAP